MQANYQRTEKPGLTLPPCSVRIPPGVGTPPGALFSLYRCNPKTSIELDTMAMLKQTRIQHLIRLGCIALGALSLLTLLAVSVSCSGWTGIRTQIYPSPDARSVSSRTEIRITFSQTMNQAEVEANLRIEPPAKGEIRWAENTLSFVPTAPLTYDHTYTVTLHAGANSTQGNQLSRDIEWAFHVGHPRLVYLRQDADQNLQIFTRDPADGTVTQLTQTPYGVWDYAIHPRGTAIAYSALRQDEGADLWQIDAHAGQPHLLLACPDDSCTWLAWSAAATQLAYERTDLSTTTIGLRSGPVVPRIWLLDLDTGDTQPLFEDPRQLSNNPIWSPTGNRLAYYSINNVAAQVIDLDTGQTHSFPTMAGAANWAPDGNRLILTAMDAPGAQNLNYLVRVDLRSGQALDISTATARTKQGYSVADGSPVWSPAGDWIAFARYSLGDGTPTWGQQLWLMRPDGSDAHPWVTDPDANLGAFAWRPDGGALAYVRVLRDRQITDQPQIWFVSLADGPPHQWAQSGVMPGWLP